MLSSEQRFNAPIPAQVAFWNWWNAKYREYGKLDQVQLEQADVVQQWLEHLGRKNLHIIEVGCGSGWMCERLVRYGDVTGTDLSHEVLERAAKRSSSPKFVPGDFMALNFEKGSYDVVVTLEVLPHVASQPAFVGKLASLLRPRGYLMLATQNRPVLERNDIPPPMAGQIRHWVDRHELARLLDTRFEIEQLFSITPQFNRGLLRIVNSRQVKAVLSGLGLSAARAWIKSAQEQAWLGWTLVCLAQKKAT